MSNVVIMNLLDYQSPWRPSGGHLPECVSFPSTKVDGGIDCYFLVWLGGSVIARIPTVPAVGGRSINGERRQPFAIAGVEKWHGLAVLKFSPAVRPVNSTLVCGKPAPGLLRGEFTR